MSDWHLLEDDDFKEAAFEVGMLEEVLDPLPLGPCSECGQFAHEVSRGHWECACFERYRG